MDKEMICGSESPLGYGIEDFYVLEAKATEAQIPARFRDDKEEHGYSTKLQLVSRAAVGRP